MKILENLRICAPQESVSDSSTLLTFFDVVFIDLKLPQPCYFFSYPHSTSHFVRSDLPNIKRSLSFTLQHFYPLAGKIRLSPGSDKQYEICYKDGDSVPLVIAESTDDFSEVSGANPCDLSKIKPLVPSQSMDDLLAVQLTVFPNQGICVGLLISHVACDGFSYIHFLKTWAFFCMQSTQPLPSTMKPSIGDHRNVLLDRFHDPYTRFITGLRQKIQIPEAKAATRNSISIKISNEEIKMLKESVQAKAKQLGKPFRYSSTYVVSSSYVWSCHAKLQRYPFDQKICFMFPFNWRRRLEPPLPPMYFGNCTLASIVSMKAGELTNEEDGLMLACEAVGNKVKELESDGIWSAITDLFFFFAHAFKGYPIFFIEMSNKLGVYDLDFGWGRPVKVGKFSDLDEDYGMYENPDDCKGVEMHIILPKDNIAEFLTIFRTGLGAFPRDTPILKDNEPQVES